VLLAGCGGGNGADAAPASQDDQVAAGQTVYAASCAKCHGAQGEGGTGPLVVGGGKRIATYGDTDRLYDYVGRTMPFDKPGSLTEDEYWQVIAYLLKENDLLPEEIVLSPEAEPIELRRT
jgi:cytochrome c